MTLNITPIKQPGVEVEQQFETRTVTPARPVLRPCVVGTNFLVVGLTITNGEYDAKAGTYDGTDDPTPYSDSFEYDYPKIDDYDDPLVDLSTHAPMVYVANDSDGQLYGLEEGVDYHATLVSVIVQKGLNVPGSTDKLVGDLLVVYRASIQDNVNKFIEVNDLDNIRSTAGTIHPWNPLAMGLYFALQQTDSSVFGTALGEDTPIGHADARDFLDLKKIYSVGVLSFIPTEPLNWANWVSDRSAPENKLESRAFCTRELITEEKLVDSSTGYTDSTNTNYIKDNNNDFIIEAVTDEFQVFITTDDWLTSTAYDIEAVPDAHTIQIDGDLALGQTSIDYKVARALSKTEQSEALAAFAYTIRNNRLCLIWPPIVEYPWDIDWDGSTEQYQDDGYLACAAVAGMCAGYIPQQGFTNVAVAGFNGLDLSNEYFTRDQLDQIAGGGWMILHQEYPESNITIRHQLTTAAANSIEEGELSIGKAVDFWAMAVRTGLTPRIGINNITDEFVDQVKLDLSAYKKMAETTQTDPRLNTSSPLARSLEILDVSQIEEEPDSIQAIVDWEPAYPANRIKIRVLI